MAVRGWKIDSFEGILDGSSKKLKKETYDSTVGDLVDSRGCWWHKKL